MVNKAASTEAQNVSDDILRIMESHQEVLIIVADPDIDAEGESRVSVFSKLFDSNGTITPYLSNILRNLLVTQNGKQCSCIEDQTPIGA